MRPATFVEKAVSVDQLTFSVALVVEPLSNVALTILEYHCAMAMLLVQLPCARVNSPIGPEELSFTMALPNLELADILITISLCHYTLAIILIIEEAACVG